MNHDTMTIDERAGLRIMQARSELIKARRFYGVLVANVEPVCSRQFPTMATNAKQHFFNPDFIMGLKKNHRGQEVHPAKLVLGVQAHESEHDARHHGTRRGERDSTRWNEACDYAINGDLIAEGFELPEGALIDARFAGMSAEDIYRTRELDEQRKQPQPQPEADEDETSDDTGDEGEGEGEGDEGDDDSMNDDGGASPSESADHDAELDPVGDSAHSLDDGQDGPGSPQDGPGEPAEGEGEDGGQGGQEATQDAPGGAGKATGQDEGDGQGEAAQASSGDPGGCGEVLDSAADAGDISEQDAKWERILRQAVSVAKAAGQLPGHISRDIAKANEPGQDWREVLRAWFDHGSLQVETWNRPNRRFVGSGLYLPGKARDGINRVAFLIDTSGSMDRLALQLICNETQAALDDGVIDEVIVLYGDTRLTREDTYKTGDEIEFDPRGGGGTDLRPLFQRVAEQYDDVSLIVGFSDMYIGDPGPEPHCPVLWAATGYPEAVREHMANSPWGAPMIDVGEH